MFNSIYFIGYMLIKREKQNCWKPETVIRKIELEQFMTKSEDL